MLKVRIEFANAKIERIAKCLGKFALEYKVWEYNDVLYAVFKIGEFSDLFKLKRRLKRIGGVQFRFSRIDFTLPWWKRWMK